MGTGRSSAARAAKGGKPKEKSMSKGDIAVVLDSTYKAYQPGRTRLAPITLLPVQDSTAYIIDEFQVPCEYTSDGKVHIRYLVGWTDLPAARVPVDAENIGDYVSARAYEQWCAEMAEKQAEARWKEEEAENVRAVEEALRLEKEAEQRAEMHERGIVLRNGTLHAPSSNEDVEEQDKLTSMVPAKMKSKGRIRAPSLTNPVPVSALMEQFESGEEDDSDEHAIYRQLVGEETTGESDSAQNDSRGQSDNAEMPLGHLERPLKKRRTMSPSPLRQAMQPSEPALSAYSSLGGSEASRSAPSNSPAPRPSGLMPPSTSRGDSSSSKGVPDRSRSSTREQREQPGTSFTPVGKGKAKWSSAGPATNTQETAKGTPTPQASRTSHNSSSIDGGTEPNREKKSTPKPPIQADQIWEVQRLEASKMFIKGGKPVRHFLVRWKGNWPKEENPTWEPEENIPKNLARKFLKGATKAGLDGASDPYPSSPAPPPVEKKWSSVGEAFSGGMEDAESSSVTVLGPNYTDDQTAESGQSGQSVSQEDEGDQEEETLFVTEEPSEPQAPSHPATFSWEMMMGRRFGGELTG